ncbi:MAG: hypothetical protein GY772_28890 [bacterium]|nr:hypothetical protein [bacterium]
MAEEEIEIAEGGTFWSDLNTGAAGVSDAASGIQDAWESLTGNAGSTAPTVGDDGDDGDELPAWVLPAVIGGGVLLLVALTRR